MPASPAAQAAQQLASYYGAIVTGGAKTMPSSTTGHLFTVATGRVMITSVTGVVSTVIQAQACTISIGNTPSGGSASTASIAAASSSVSGVAAGATFGVPAYSSGAAALVFTGANGILPGVDLGVSLDDGGLYLVPAGTIDWTTSATNTGAVTWTVGYVPYDAGATVTAL
jgi:hypothetical protein